MTIDYFIKRKSVHLDFDRDVHIALKVKLMEHGISMQETFETIARSIVKGNPHLNDMIERIALKKLRLKLSEMDTADKEEARRVMLSKRITELDSEVLYSLIEESKNNEVTK